MSRSLYLIDGFTCRADQDDNLFKVGGPIRFFECMPMVFKKPNLGQRSGRALAFSGGIAAACLSDVDATQTNPFTALGWGINCLDPTMFKAGEVCRGT